MADNNTTGTATSRAGTVRKATRKATKGRVAMSGPSGSGKTWTALSIAEVLAPGGRYVLIDTEPSDDNNTAAELYADRFSFDLIDWTEPPYDPRDLTLTIKDLGNEGIDVLIVDSGSAFWRGQGGTLDVVDGAFGGWRTGTPAQNAMVDAILKAPFHVIFCTRAKQSYEVEQGRDGKQTVRKLGLAPIQRDDLEYEFQVVAMIDIDHRIDIGKTRCADLAGMSFHANQQAEFGKTYKAWLDKGLVLITQTDADLLREALAAIGSQEDRNRARREFKDAFGSPDVLEVDQLAAAWATTAALAGIDPHPYQPDVDDPHRCATCTLGRRAGWHDGLVSAAAQTAAGNHDADGETDDDDLTDEDDPRTDLGEGKTGPPPATTEATPPVTEPPATGTPETEGNAGDGHTGAENGGPPAKTPAQRVEGFRQAIGGMSVTKVRQQLKSAGLDEGGSAPVIRARLLDRFLHQAGLTVEGVELVGAAAGE